MALLTAALLLVAAPAGAVVPSGNQLLNPGAEDGDGGADQAEVRPPPQWGAIGNFTAVEYGAPDFPTEAMSDAIGGATNFFAGGPSNAASAGTQQVDLAQAGAEIDAGTVSMTLSGYLGGYFTDDDQAIVSAEIRDESADNVLGTLQIGPVTAADRSNATQLLFRSATAEVPADAREVNVAIVATRFDGAYNDGYADNVSLTLDREPTAVNDSATVPQDAPASGIDVLANDTDPDGGPKQVASVTQPASGTAAVAATGVTYKPKPGACGGSDDTFGYTLNGGSTATVTVKVTCTPPTPAQPKGDPTPLPPILPPPSQVPTGRGFCTSATPPARAAATLTGTAAPNVLIGTPVADTITGLDGDDSLIGLGGNDSIDGGAGDDTICGDGACPPGVSNAAFCVAGSTGADRIFGGAGRDTINGDAGDDRLSGQGGDDRLRGNAGNDRLSGGSGDDRLTGGAGRDQLTGSGGDDVLTGGSGNDRLTGSSGRDRITAGAGSDRINARDNARDRINCGSGRDRVTADGIDRVHRNCERVSRTRTRGR